MFAAVPQRFLLKPGRYLHNYLVLPDSFDPLAHQPYIPDVCASCGPADCFADNTVQFERGKEKKGEEEVPKSCERGERKEVEASG